MKKNRFPTKIIILCMLSIFFTSGIFGLYILNIDVPYICYSGPYEGIWSIGIYDLAFDGKSLILSEKIKNPVLTAAHVTDMSARFVADPFLVKEKNIFYLFFEVLGVDRGVIGLAKSSDGFHWDYNRIVLEEPFHLSYPNVFKWKNDYYLIPESVAVNSVRLYKAINFPDRWQFIKTIITGRQLVDSTVLIYRDMLWLFSSSIDNKNLYLFYSEQPEGPWTEHPESPVVRGDGQKARPAGNMLDTGVSLIRFSQDSRAYGEHYGKAVMGFEVDKITREVYRESPLGYNPILKGSGAGWNSEGMHQISAIPINGRFLAAVDGKRRSNYHIICLGNKIIKIP
jgi:hypothetical protein